ncbi:MAG TPA: hypothetical protein VM598_09630 [Bdellovibrionota bacterium]|nr:hypothetical protein [Bdellovibrionota bacterium]
MRSILGIVLLSSFLLAPQARAESVKFGELFAALRCVDMDGNEECELLEGPDELVDLQLMEDPDAPGYFTGTWKGSIPDGDAEFELSIEVTKSATVSFGIRSKLMVNGDDKPNFYADATAPTNEELNTLVLLGAPIVAGARSWWSIAIVAPEEIKLATLKKMARAKLEELRKRRAKIQR